MLNIARVHNQRLDTNFTESGDACLACRHLHGHEGLIKVFLEECENESNVEKTGMVTDFKHLGWFKNFLDDTLDHKFIMDIKDPLINYEVPELTDHLGNFDLSKCHLMPEGYYIPDLTLIRNMLDSLKDETTESQKSAIFEKYEGMIFVDFVPTSENLAAWLLSVVQEKMKDLSGVRVKAVEYWETPKSHCRVEA
jgi:6-pyruvoyltetrahydropterin/6-carboxytetrahydropterin synthase